MITVPKKKVNGFFHVELDISEEEIDEILIDSSIELTESGE